MATSRAVSGLVAVIVVGAAFAACAQGNQLGGVGGSITLTGATSASSGKPSTSSSSGGPGGIGSPCPTGQCAEGTCTIVGSTKYCTQACPPECPSGTYCSIILGSPICIPDLGQECGVCTTATDCKEPSDACLTGPDGDQFCARDCSVDGLCPSGYECTSQAAYGQDGGTGDGGTGGSGTSGASSGTGGTGTGGSGPLPSAPDRWCVPAGNMPCPCDTARDGSTSTCTITNANGTCTGTQTCDGHSGTYMGCTAMTPMPEICNGKDDNCNGQIDEGNPNTLCASMGSPPANANWACINGMCTTGACNNGWAQFPPGTTGCTCPIDANEPNNTCSQATKLATVTSSGTPITVEGTLSSATDIDVYSFTTTDIPGATSNTYHVQVSFTMPAANTEFVMDVERTGTCSDTPTGGAVKITSYDYCVDGQSGMLGENPCGPTATNHCDDQSSPYFVRVYRGTSATATCTPYQLTITAAAGACTDTTWAQCN